MDGMLALTIVCVVFAIGDFISDKTHAIIPVLLFASVTFPFSCADSYGFVDGNCMPIPQDTYRQAIPQTQVAV